MDFMKRRNVKVMADVWSMDGTGFFLVWDCLLSLAIIC